MAPALIWQPAPPDCRQEQPEDNLQQLEPDVSGRLGASTWFSIHESTVVMLKEEG